LAGRDGFAGAGPVAVGADVEDRVGQAGEAHRDRVMDRRGAAAARRDDRAVRAVSAERPEPRPQLGRRAEPAVARLPSTGALRAVGMWPATGSIGSISPR
jgi:hypothetical protein